MIEPFEEQYFKSLETSCGRVGRAAAGEIKRLRKALDLLDSDDRARASLAGDTADDKDEEDHG